MKEVIMFMTPTCPHCKKAFELMEEICCDQPEYKKVEIKTVDERQERELADKYDYYYIPTYYVDGVKVHEGTPSRESVEKVYETAVK